MEHNPPAPESGPAISIRSRLDFVLIGVVAAGAALAASELVSGLFLSAPSLIRTIGQRVIDISPVPVVDWAISTFGTNDKLVLIIGIVVVSLLIGGFLGLLARDRPGLAAAGFVVFGVVGYVAGRTDPLAGAVLTLVAAVAAAGMGVGVLLGLRFLLQRSVSPTADGAIRSRRVFLTAAAATVATSVGEALLGRYFGSRVRSAVIGREQVTLPTVFPSADDTTTTTTAGAADMIATTETTSAAAETIQGTETPSTTAATSEITQAPAPSATDEADPATAETTETTQRADATTASTEAAQPADATTASTEAAQPAETTTTAQPVETTTTAQPVETTTTAQPVETTTTAQPVETTTTTQPVETTTTTQPVETTTTTEPAVSGVANPTPAQIAPVDGVSDLITPNDEFYIIDTALSVPVSISEPGPCPSPGWWIHPSASPTTSCWPCRWWSAT